MYPQNPTGAGLLTAVRCTIDNVAVTNHVAEVVLSGNYSLAYGGSTLRPRNLGDLSTAIWHGMTHKRN